MIQAERTASVLEPGTPMVKAIPPRLVEPYLTGQRLVIAGYVHRAMDCGFSGPSDYFYALGLGYQGSEFTPDAPELFVLRWAALDMPASLVPVRAEIALESPAAIPAYFTLPVPIPVGAEVHRITARGDELAARYDGQVWATTGGRTP